VDVLPVVGHNQLEQSYTIADRGMGTMTQLEWTVNPNYAITGVAYIARQPDGGRYLITAPQKPTPGYEACYVPADDKAVERLSGVTNLGDAKALAQAHRDRAARP
jgi:hypothetical protein